MVSNQQLQENQRLAEVAHEVMEEHIRAINATMTDLPFKFIRAGLDMLQAVISFRDLAQYIMISCLLAHAAYVNFSDVARSSAAGKFLSSPCL